MGCSKREEPRMYGWHGIEPSRQYCVKHVRRKMDPVQKWIIIVGVALIVFGIWRLL